MVWTEPSDSALFLIAGWLHGTGAEIDLQQHKKHAATVALQVHFTLQAVSRSNQHGPRQRIACRSVPIAVAYRTVLRDVRGRG